MDSRLNPGHRAETERCAVVFLVRRDEKICTFRINAPQCSKACVGVPGATGMSLSHRVLSSRVVPPAVVCRAIPAVARRPCRLHVPSSPVHVSARSPQGNLAVRGMGRPRVAHRPHLRRFSVSSCHRNVFLEESVTRVCGMRARRRLRDPPRRPDLPLARRRARVASPVLSGPRSVSTYAARPPVAPHGTSPRPSRTGAGVGMRGTGPMAATAAAAVATERRRGCTPPAESRRPSPRTPAPPTPARPPSRPPPLTPPAPPPLRHPAQTHPALTHPPPPPPLASP